MLRALLHSFKKIRQEVDGRNSGSDPVGCRGRGKIDTFDSAHHSIKEHLQLLKFDNRNPSMAQSTLRYVQFSDNEKLRKLITYCLCTKRVLGT